MERSTLGQHSIGAGMLVLALCAVQAGAADALPLEGCATGQAPRQDVWIGVFGEDPETGLGARRGHGSDWHAVTVPRRPLELEIRPYLVRGRVLDANSGHPVENFRVVAHVGAAQSETTSVNDDAGVFAVAVDIATTWIVVEADGRFPRLEQLTIGAESETDLGDIGLEADRSIAGRVVDERTGAPIEGAWLSLRPEPGDALWVVAGLSPPAKANTDADGAFALHGNPAGRFRVQASAAGYASKYVQVPSDESWIDVELEAGAAIAGSLSLPDGTPVNGSIFVFFRTGGHGWGDAITDGVFRLEGLSDGDYVLQASSDAGPVEKRLVTIRDGQSVEDVRMTVRPGGEVSGSITGLAEGERVKFAVAERGGRPRPVRGRQIGTAAYGNGAFSLRGMPASATINASTSNGRMLRRDIVLDHHGEAVIDLDFSGRSRIAGVVTAGDRPAAGVEIAALPTDRFQPSARARTDNDGRYALSGLVDGPHMVRVYTGQSFDVVVDGEAALDIELPANSFSGSVTLRRENTRALVRVALSPAQSEQPRFKLQRRIRGGGAFHFDGLPSGEYTVDASAEGYERVSRRIHISGDEEMRFVLESNADELVRSGLDSD